MIGQLLEHVVQDARAGARIVKTSTGLSATVIILVALVIGANATIYSTVQTILTKPAAGVDGAGLVTLERVTEGRPAGPGHSYADYVDYVAQSTTTQPLLADTTQSFTLTLDDGSYAIRGVSVTANYFETLGIRFARGRPFTPEESRLDSSGLVAVIGYRLWQERFGGADDVLGRAIDVNGHAARIIGVAAPGFVGIMLGERSELWVPLQAYARLLGTEAFLTDRTREDTVIVGRLKPGMSLRSAQAEFTTISARLASVYPETNKTKSVWLVPYSVTAAGDSIVARNGRRFLAIFSVVTVLTLVIVCANVANLLLARMVGRQRDVAIRLSLGAARSRVVRLLLAEGLVLSSLAAMVAFAVAWWVSRAISAFFAAQSAGGFGMIDFTPDQEVFAYALGLAVASALLFSAAPAIRVWKQDLLPFLKPGEYGVVGGRSWLSSTLAGLQLGFCVLLLTLAGLGYRSLTLIEAADVGFDTERLLIVRVNAGAVAANGAGRVAMLEQVRERLQATQGVTAATYVRVTPPFGAATEPTRAQISSEPIFAERNQVGPNFFAMLGTPPVAGREFLPEDANAGRPIAVINQALADRLWPGESAVGRSLIYGRDRQPLEIVGVAPNALFHGFRPDRQPGFVFLPERQTSDTFGRMTFYVRYTGALETVVPAVRTSLRQLDARLPIESFTSMDAALEDTTAPVRMITVLLAWFAVGSTLIAAIGLYGLVAFEMRRRTREFGVRIAVGASARQLLRSVLREGATLTSIGLAAGFLLSIGAATLARGLLYGITPIDPRTYVAVFALLVFISLVASYIPARRASRVDPVLALRQE